MGHLPHLIQDLGLILMAAAVMTLLFKWMKQPIVLGYLIAGFIVSEYFPGPILGQYLPDFVHNYTHVQDNESIKIWSEIGVIFMLFGLGLEFSFKKLLAVGRTAAITGGFEVFTTTIIGFFVGKLLGWTNMDSIFFGAMLAMSSTTIIVKVFDELNLKGRAFAPIVFGGLIVEDLLAILLLVLLSSIAVSQQFAGGELLFSSFKLVFFLVLWFIMGIFLLPWFLKKCRKLLTDEILLVVSVGLCFLMVVIACNTGFSAALGAFVMGSLLAETSKGTRIEHVTQPVKDLFSAVFFVSVGMLIDPTILYEYAGTITMITILTIVAKFVGTGGGALLAGCNLKNSMQAGMSMAQIGEFSFIIATLGKQLGVISEFLYPVAVAVSAVTTLTTPYLIKSSEPIADWINARIPERIHVLLLRYEVTMKDHGKQSVFSLFWKIHGLKIAFNSVMVVGIVLCARYVVASFGEQLASLMNGNQTIADLCVCAVAVLVAAPFLWGVFHSRPTQIEKYDTKTIAQLQKLQFGVLMIRFFAGSTLVAALTFSFMSFPVFFIVFPIVVCMFHLRLFRSRFATVYERMENQFIAHLSDKERAAFEEKAKFFNYAPWEVSLTEFVLSQGSPLVAKTLQNSELKSRFGVIVAMIERGDTRLLPPKGDDLLLPYDKIFLIGSDEQLIAARAEIEKTSEIESDDFKEHLALVSLILTPEHPFASKLIRDCGIRESVNGLIVGLEREGKRYLNPDPSVVLLPDDLLWIVGHKTLLRQLE